MADVEGRLEVVDPVVWKLWRGTGVGHIFRAIELAPEAEERIILARARGWWHCARRVVLCGGGGGGGGDGVLMKKRHVQASFSASIKP